MLNKVYFTLLYFTLLLLYIIIYFSEDVFSLYPVKPSMRSFYRDDVTG